MKNETNSSTGTALAKQLEENDLEVIQMTREAFDKALEVVMKKTRDQLATVSSTGERSVEWYQFWASRIRLADMKSSRDKRDTSLTDSVIEARAILKMEVGDSYGLNPVESQAMFYFVDGMIAPSYKLRLSQVAKSKNYHFQIVDLTAEKCTGRIYKNGVKLDDVTYTLEDAKKAGSLDKSTWKKHPKRMCLSKVAHLIFDTYCSDLRVDSDITFDSSETSEIPQELFRAPDTTKQLATEDKKVEVNSKNFIETDPQTVEIDKEEVKLQELRESAFELLENITGGDEAEKVKILEKREINKIDVPGLTALNEELRLM